MQNTASHTVKPESSRAKIFKRLRRQEIVSKRAQSTKKSGTRNGDRIDRPAINRKDGNRVPARTPQLCRRVPNATAFS